MNEMNDKNETVAADSKGQCNKRRSSKKGNRGRNKRNSTDYETRQFSGKQSAPVRNNASMYFSNPILADQVSSFSFNQFMGSTDNLGPVGALSAPTISTYWINPCPGYSIGDVHTGINVDGLKLYTMLSASNAKTTQYAPQDVTTLILAMGEVISLTEVIKRAMGVAYTYNIRNRSLPLQVVSAMGIDPSFITNGSLATLRIKLNTALNQANAIPFFSNIPYLEKCKRLYQVYYMDSESPMAQLIIPMPMTTWQLNETASAKGTVLQTVGVTRFDGTMTLLDHNTDLANLIIKLDSMINALLTSSTYNYIYSDMLRVFGDKSAFYTFELLPEGYSVFPEYNPMFCLQMHNATAVGAPLQGLGVEEETPYNDVYPNPDTLGLRWNPRFITEQSPTADDYTRMQALTMPQIIDFPHSMGNPSVDQRVDATRYKAMFKMNGNVVTDATFPDHYVSFVSYLTPDAKMTARFSTSVWNNKTDLPNSLSMNVIKSKFDYDILTYVVDQITTGSVNKYQVVGDLDFWTTVDFNYLKGVNDLCAAGLYELRSISQDNK